MHLGSTQWKRAIIKLFSLVILTSTLIHALDYSTKRLYLEGINYYLVEINHQPFFYLLNDQAYSRANRFIAKVSHLLNTGYDQKKIEIIDNRALSIMYGKEELVLLSESEKIFSTKMGIDFEQLLSLFQEKKIQTSFTTVTHKEFVPFGIVAINEMFSQNDSLAIKKPCFRAIHPDLPPGTKIRLENKKGWTVVVTIVKNEKIPDNRVVSIESQAAYALGLDQHPSESIKLSIL